MRCKNNDEAGLIKDLTSEDKSSVIALVRKAIQSGQTIENIKNMLQTCIDSGCKGKIHYFIKTNSYYLCDCIFSIGPDILTYQKTFFVTQLKTKQKRIFCTSK